MKKFLLLCFIAFLSPVLQISAQDLQSDIKTTAANFFTGDGYTLSWTIGEAVILTVSDSSFTMTQGFQQPKFRKKYVKSDLPKKDNIDVGPNPAVDEVEIKLDRPIDKNIPIKAEIFDAIGRRVIVKEFHGQRVTVNISYLASGVYFVRLTVDGVDIGTQKLQKLD
ncbi:MAG: T9SS type A sorting domain-containing protein [Bacteroidota bacterium]